VRRILSLLLVLSTAVFLSACKSAEERAEEHYQNALTLLEEGDVDRAIVELRNVFELNGSHLEARRQLADLLLNERGNPQGAYSQYLRLAEQYPDDVETRIALAELAFAAANWDEVERHGLRAEELTPDDPRVQALTIARAYRVAALDDNAPVRREQARAATDLLDSQSESIVLRNILIDNHLRDGEFNSALRQVDWLLERDPDNQLYWRQRLQILAQLGDDEGLEAQLVDMVDRFPDDSEHKATLIRFFLSQGDLDKAEAFLRDLAAASDEPGPTVDLIRFLAEARSIEAAQDELARIIPEAADPIPFQIIGAALDFSVGEQDQAIAALEDILRSQGDDADPEVVENVTVALARMLRDTGNEVGARARVEEVLADNPDNPEALKMQARWQIEADDTDGAISALRLALESSREDAEAMTLMAEAYTRAGSPSLARDFLALAVDASGNAPAESVRYARLLIEEERYLPAEDTLLPALRLAPQNIEILVTLGQLYLEMDDLGRAQQVADTLRRLETPEAIGAANGLEAERLNRQAGPDEAMAYLEQIAGGQDATMGTKVSLIRARLATGDLDGALDQARDLAAENPGNEAVTFVLAATEAVNGNAEAAESLYRGLIDANPERPTVWLELARLKQRQGDPDGALALVEEGLGHLPQDGGLLWAKASFLERAGDIDGAIAIYEGLYETDSNSIIVANNLASLLSTWRDDAESLDRAWIIARRFSEADIPALQDTYGWIAFRRGETDTALPYLEAAAEGLSGDPLVQYHLGRTYEDLGRSDDAQQQYARAIEIAGPADSRPQIEDARARLQALGAEAGSD